MAKNSRIKDMTGLQFGELTVIHQDGNRPKGAAIWLCQCSCGKQTRTTGSDLRQGKSNSCGHERAERIQSLNKSHGQSNTRLYEIWKNMICRCRPDGHKNYGKRGIRVCDEWKEFDNFYAWAHASGYTDALTIERINSDDWYKPENCSWIPMNEQSLNRAYVNKRADGKLWLHVARENGITDTAFKVRCSAGWDREEAATWPMYTRRPDKQHVRDSKGKFIK